MIRSSVLKCSSDDLDQHVRPETFQDSTGPDCRIKLASWPASNITNMAPECALPCRFVSVAVVARIRVASMPSRVGAPASSATTHGTGKRKLQVANKKLKNKGQPKKKPKKQRKAHSHDLAHLHPQLLSP
jgi:hypothetical protein